MEDFAEFVLTHENDDTAALLLSRHKWGGIDVGLAVNTIESRRKLRNKLPEWYSNPNLILPLPLSAEQCSSAETAAYKAGIVKRHCPEKPSVADLTGGLGADATAFAGLGGKVLYNEMNPVLADAARHNFTALGVPDIEIRSFKAGESPVGEILGDFRPHLIYLDPARRGADGRKVFLPEDCSPDIISLLTELMRHARFILLKISPMADISMMTGRLNGAAGRKVVKEVHAVACGGECRELLFLLDVEHDGDFIYTVYEGGKTLQFTAYEESESALSLPENEGILPSLCGMTLFEPGKALMKAGAFNLPCSRFGLMKLARFTHLYISDKSSGDYAGFGKTFTVREILPLDKRSMKYVGENWPRAEFTARNIPMTSEQLRARCKSSSGSDIHVFGVHIDFRNGKGGNYLIVSDV